MLRFDRFTVKAQEALAAAQERAARHEQQQIEPPHLLAALTEQRDGILPALLAKLGVRPEALAADIELALGKLPKVTGVSQTYLGPATQDVLRGAFDEAASFKDEYVSTEHLLVALAALQRDAAAEILARHGITPEAILQALATIRGSHRVTRPALPRRLRPRLRRAPVEAQHPAPNSGPAGQADPGGRGLAGRACGGRR